MSFEWLRTCYINRQILSKKRKVGNSSLTILTIRRLGSRTRLRNNSGEIKRQGDDIKKLQKELVQKRALRQKAIKDAQLASAMADGFINSLKEMKEEVKVKRIIAIKH